MNDLTLNLSNDPADHIAKLAHRLRSVKCPNCKFEIQYSPLWLI